MRPSPASGARARSRPTIVLWVGLSIAIMSALAGAMFLRPTRPNVLLVTIDTTRADHVGCYGYGAGTTPTLDALAASGVRFTNARVQAPITGPSHATLLTGAMPTFHGVVGNLQALPSSGVATLAECFQQAGYRTGAAVGAFVVASAWGFARGFDTFLEQLPIAPSGAAVLPERHGEAVIADATAWLRQKPTKPFFLWVHLFDPHSPYAPPPSFASHFSNPYDAEIAYADRCVGDLLAALDTMKLRKHTLVVVTSDHGESLGEHDEDTHAFFLYNSTLSVPLIVSLPPGAGKGSRVDDLVRSADVMPTILDLVGLPVPPTVQGASAASAVHGGKLEPAGRASFALTDELHQAFAWSTLRSIERDGWKYIRAPKPELFDLHADPGERTNLAEKEPDRVRALEAALSEELSRTKGDLPHETHAIDPATLERLMSLGYVAGGSRSTPTDGGDVSGMVDPKDRLAYWAKYRRLSALRADGDLPEAERLGRELLTEDANPPLVNYLFGQILWRKSERSNDPAVIREAAAHLERASVMEEYRNSCLAFMGIAHARLGEMNEAKRVFGEILTRSPDEPMANFNLTLIYAREQNWPAVVQHGEALLRRLPSHPDAKGIRQLVEKARAAMAHAS